MRCEYLRYNRGMSNQTIEMHGSVRLYEAYTQWDGLPVYYVIWSGINKAVFSGETAYADAYREFITRANMESYGRISTDPEEG